MRGWRTDDTLRARVRELENTLRLRDEKLAELGWQLDEANNRIREMRGLLQNIAGAVNGRKL